MSSKSPTRPLYQDDTRIPASRRNSVDLRHHAILSTVSQRSSWAPPLPDSLDIFLSTSSNSRTHADEGFTADSLLVGQEWHHNAVFAPPASLLNSRRASLASLSESVELLRRHRTSRTDLAEANMTSAAQPFGEPVSPDDGGNFRRSLQIDMKDLVGDAVGNVSAMDPF